VHALRDFGRDFYGENMEVVMIGYVRPEMRFDGLPALVWRVGSDAILVESAVVLYTPGGYPWRVPLEGTHVGAKGQVLYSYQYVASVTYKHTTPLSSGEYEWATVTAVALMGLQMNATYWVLYSCYIPNAKPQTPHPKPKTQNPNKPLTLNPKP
jgi:hypothetical protein